MLVFGNGVLRPHHLWRGCTEFKSGLASIMMIAPLSLADQENVNTAQVVKLVLENQQDSSRFIHCTRVICENYPKLSMYNWDTAVCECMGGTKMCDVSLQKLMFGGALSLLQSLKGGTNGTLESMVTL